MKDLYDIPEETIREHLRKREAKRHEPLLRSAEGASKVIAEKMKGVSGTITECEKIADDFGVSFSSPIDHWSMGGSYKGGHGEKNEGGDWDKPGWHSSTEGCQ